MKKKVLIALLAVVLIVVGIVGGVYAVDHQPMQGNKLVGYGPQGKQGESPIIYDSCIFTFTNPDCLYDIAINRVSIISRRGETLTVAYEGPYMVIKQDDGTRIPVSVLKPHGIGKIELWNWMPDGSGGWLSEEEAREIPVASYTVEIAWSAKGSTCPLIGYGQRNHADVIPSQTPRSTAHYVPMENMKQTIK